MAGDFTKIAMGLLVLAAFILWAIFTTSDLSLQTGVPVPSQMAGLNASSMQAVSSLQGSAVNASTQLSQSSPQQNPLSFVLDIFNTAGAAINTVGNLFAGSVSFILTALFGIIPLPFYLSKLPIVGLSVIILLAIISAIMRWYM